MRRCGRDRTVATHLDVSRGHGVARVRDGVVAPLLHEVEVGQPAVDDVDDDAGEVGDQVVHAEEIYMNGGGAVAADKNDFASLRATGAQTIVATSLGMQGGAGGESNSVEIFAAGSQNITGSGPTPKWKS